MEHRQDIAYQMDLFTGQNGNAIRRSENCEDAYGAKAGQAWQLNKEGQQGRALTGKLMAIVCSSDNLKRAYKQVKRNKGVAGIDQMPTGKFADWFISEGESLINDLLHGNYQPQGVKQAEIPKPKGGMRKLGIPTVRDRIIQQAIAQVLSPIYGHEFSKRIYGYLPRRNAQQALRRAREYVMDGREVVVDMDMKSFFDEVNHGRLMYGLSTRMGDKILLGLIRKYLQSGILLGGLISQRTKGTPQGSPLSPVLSNIVLDELDKELENRGHCFVRYADDFSIYVRSQKAGESVKKPISTFITNNLKLKVNEEKSVVCEVDKTVLLGHTILKHGDLVIAKENVERFKNSIRKITKHNRGVSFEQVVSELNPKLRGWFEYYKHTRSKWLFRGLDAWVRKKLRCFRIKQTKRTIGLVRFLKKRGVPSHQSWIIALSGVSWWRKSAAPQIHLAMDNSWFREQNLFNLSFNFKKLKY